MGLRPYQQTASERISEFLSEPPSRKLIVMATGTGKTHVIVDAIHQAWYRAKLRTLVLVHRLELVEQVEARIKALWPELRVGVEQAERFAPSDSVVVVASVQTLSGADTLRLDWFKPGFVIVDEAHHAAAESYQSAITRVCGNMEPWVLGLTATPHRLDGEAVTGEDACFEGVLFEYSIREAIEDCWLVDPIGHIVRSDLDLDEISVSGGDFAVGKLAERVNTDGRTGAAFKRWLEVAKERQTIAFCVNIEHAESTASYWASHGFRAEAISSKTPMQDRKRILQDYHRGDIQFIANAAILTEGFDAPATGCILMLRPTKSWAFYSQCIGRGTRPLPGVVDARESIACRKSAIAASAKPDVLVIDVVDNARRHSICTMPALVGLPAEMDPAGMSLGGMMEVKDAIDCDVTAERDCLTLDQLFIRIEEIRLTAIRGAEKKAKQDKDWVGYTWGEWTVIAYIGVQKGNRWWRCRCSCGSIKDKITGHLGHSSSCGCKKSDDLTGRRFGRLVVTEMGRREGISKAIARCDCGSTKEFFTGALVSGRTTSCGCYNLEALKGRRRSRLSEGVVIGRLTLINREVETVGGKPVTSWICVCECGATKRVRASNLTSGCTKSCGCLGRENIQTLALGRRASRKQAKEAAAA